MSKLKAFFYIFSKSLTSIKYYKDVVSSDKRLSIKYFFSLALLASVVTSVYTLIPMIPNVRNSLDTFVGEVVAMYEDDLEITIENGALSINREEPYVVPVSGKYGMTEGGPNNLLVIDVNGTVDDFLNKYDSYIMINSSNIMFQDSSGMKVESLSQVPDGVITKEDVVNLSYEVQRFLVYVPYILSVFMFVGIFIYYAILRFVYLFVVALMFFALGKIKGTSYGYVDNLKIAIHTFTLPVVIEVVLHAFDLPLAEVFPLWFMAVNVLFGAVVVFNLSDSDTKLIEKNS